MGRRSRDDRVDDYDEVPASCGRADLIPKKLDRGLRPDDDETESSKKGASASSKGWLASSIRLARSHEHSFDYVGRRAIEWLAARRLRASLRDNASWFDLFNFAKMKIDVQVGQTILTIPFVLPDGLEEHVVGPWWGRFSHGVDPKGSTRP